MGKQRNKDRAYISASEWATEWGGRKDRGELPFSRLPFHCCALTFTPFGAPQLCARSGSVDDLLRTNRGPGVHGRRRVL
jgi:peptidyl-prolyl cis-trans isomerase-like protein 2